MSSRRHVKARTDPGLAYLLELDGSIESQTTSGYWTKIEVRRVKASPARPYGVKYSLTLHSPAGDPLIGFDNAHSIKPAARGGTRFPWDHWHSLAQLDAVFYEYRTAYQLLNDFYDEVKRVLKEVSDEQDD
jgi:hypothetical protein